MNAMKLLIGTVVGTISVFVFDYLFYGILMREKFTLVAGVDREWPEWLWLILGLVVVMAVFTYFYAHGASGNNRTQQGMRFGIVFGVLMFGIGLIMYSIQIPRPLNDYLIDGVYSVVKNGIVGIIIAHAIGIPGVGGGRGKGSSGGSGDN